MEKTKYLITSALPYANGPLHLGHIAGAYLPADIYARFQRLRGHDVLYVCGTDEHGVPITLKAEKQGVSPRKIVGYYHQNIKENFARLNISLDNFSGTSHYHNKHHAKLARQFFMNLYKNDLVISRIKDQHYCEKCQRFLADRYMEGTCPSCGYEEARGDECSQCNSQFDPLDLVNPVCKICNQGKQPVIRPTKHWYLRLDKLQPTLEEWINNKTYWKENVVNFVKGWLKQGLKERAITRDLYWGVPVPLDQAAGKVLYVWFDAPIGYISSTMEYGDNQGKPELWKEYWQNPKCRVVHFIGKDNIPFHAIIWPALLLGQEEGYQLPWHIPANEYLNFGTSAEEEEHSVKASTSKGNVVWLHESLDCFQADYIRYYLAACAPEKHDVIFTWRDFQQRCNHEILGVLGNLVNRILKFLEKNFQGEVPSAALSERDQQALEQIQQAHQRIGELFEKFEVRQAVSEIVRLGRLGNQYFDEKAPWKSSKTDPQDCQNCMFVGVQFAKALAILLSPIIPESAQKIWWQLGYDEEITWDKLQEQVAPGHKIRQPEGIFKKIEDSTILELENKLKEAMTSKEQPPKASQAKAETMEEAKTVKEQISYDHFAKLDIQIGEILEAQKAPKADKLLQLKVQLGEETRQIIAGIAEHYSAEELVGKKVPVLANLKPAKIRGLVSEGMILCADSGEDVVLLHPGKDLPSGSTVR